MTGRGTILVCLSVALCSQAISQNRALPELKTSTKRIDYRIGNEYYKGQWTISPEAKPDVLTVFVAPGKKLQVSFISDLSQISFDVEAGKSYDFNIVRGQDVCWTRISGLKLVPAATYDASFMTTHRGKVEASVPEVYELVNIAIAITDFARAKNWGVLSNTEYGKDVLDWFMPYQNEPIIQALDKQLKIDSSVYDGIRMNGNAFAFDREGNIVPRREYTRTGYAYEKSNPLEPFVAGLSKFSKDTRFHEFYSRHISLYKAQKDFFLNDAKAANIAKWLGSQFPESVKYDFIDIVFSPIAGGSTSVTWFESNDFRTLQPHINYPFPAISTTLPNCSPEANAICRGSVLLSELSRGYLTFASAAYRKSITKAIGKGDQWVNRAKFSNFNATWLFEAYMNGGLFAVWVQNRLPSEADRITEFMIGVMEAKGFIRFREFQTNLLHLYRSRKPGLTVYDLYPEIIKWFIDNN